MLALLKQRNFFIFWFGELISVVGDHISIIAFPWLVLQMTGSPAMTGLVLAAQGLPRAILMLWGGAIVDRTSPRAVMIITDIVRFALMLTLGYMIQDGTQTLPIIFAFAAVFGIADAFFYPATTSILPSLVKKSELQKGNAIVQMTNHTAIILGPVIAGLLIMGELAMPDSNAAPTVGSNFTADQTGLARAFIVDAWTFAASIVTLMLIKVRPLRDATDAAEKTSVFQDIKLGLKFVWSIPALRLCFIGIAMLEFFFQAPIFVGLPVLAKARFADGALVYGMELAAYGAGALIGSSIAGTVKPMLNTNITRNLFLVFTWSGLCLALIVIFPPYQVAMVLFFTAGIGDNYMWVHFMTWLQQVTPEKLLGRVMSILMFLAIGMLPVANMTMGFLFEIHLEATLIVCSLMMVGVSLMAAFHKDAKKVTAQAEKVKI